MRFTPGIVGVSRGPPASLVFREPNTNVIPNPEAINLWAMASCVVTANALADPDGAMTAETLTDNAAGATAPVSVSSTPVSTIAISQLYRASAYIKAGTVPWVRLLVINLGSLSQLNVYFNLSTGATGTIGTHVTAAGADAAISGWRRFWFTFMSDVADTTCNMSIGMASANNAATVVRNGTQTMHVWLAQLARV